MRWLLLLALLTIACGPPAPDPENPGDQGVELWQPLFAPVPQREPCSPERVELIRAPADTEHPAVGVHCNLDLEPGDVVTKRLVLSGEPSSGVTLDCHGATLIGQDAIVIRSREVEGGWEPAHDITIRDCVVRGSIRVQGIGVNASASALRDSSHRLEHVRDTRDAAPYRVTLSGLTVIGAGRIPVYFAAGVHHCALRGSHITGESAATMVYLDAETTRNQLADNTIVASDASREAIAVDGSSHNTIRGNTLTGLRLGGVYLYRNCGERGVVRHTTPSHNTIEENTMRCPWPMPGVFLGSRDGRRFYCGEDRGWPYGSSISDYDHARWNRVKGNELGRCVVRVGNETNRGNEVKDEGKT